VTAACGPGAACAPPGARVAAWGLGAARCWRAWAVSPTCIIGVCLAALRAACVACLPAFQQSLSVSLACMFVGTCWASAERALTSPLHLCAAQLHASSACKDTSMCRKVGPHLHVPFCSGTLAHTHCEHVAAPILCDSSLLHASRINLLACTACTHAVCHSKLFTLTSHMHPSMLKRRPAAAAEESSL